MEMNAGSPKRKRGHALPLDTKVVGLRFLNDSDLEDHVESPKTKFARQFDDLEIRGHFEKLDRDAVQKMSPSPEHAQRERGETPAQEKKSVPPRRKRIPQSPAKAKSVGAMDSVVVPENTRCSRSPPLASELSDEFWHDSEITGHDPDDPDDDGYGINGVGFKPTAAMAWSRSQQRKQQLNDYKNREARDARQERSERRKRLFDENDEAPSMESSPRKAIRVHFEDG